MKRKLTLLLVGLALLIVLVALCLFDHGDWKPHYYARGRLLVPMDFKEPDREPDITNFYKQWAAYRSNRFVNINNWLTDSEKLAYLTRISSAQERNVKFVEIQPIRNVEIIEVRFSGNDQQAVWRVASNACVMLATFCATNQLHEFPATNQVTCKAQHIDTAFWKPQPVWQQALERVKNSFRF